MKTPRERFALTLEAIPDGGAPAVIRLRRFLKAALRSYGLRCTFAVALADDPGTPASDSERGDRGGRDRQRPTRPPRAPDSATRG